MVSKKRMNEFENIETTVGGRGIRRKMGKR